MASTALSYQFTGLTASTAYTLGVAGGATIEDVAKVAPDVFWLQLYRFYQNDHAIGFDLIKRATAAGVKALLTAPHKLDLVEYWDNDRRAPRISLNAA